MAKERLEGVYIGPLRGMGSVQMSAKTLAPEDEKASRYWIADTCPI